MRCTPVRCTPIKYTLMRCTPVRYTPKMSTQVGDSEVEEEYYYCGYICVRTATTAAPPRGAGVVGAWGCCQWGAPESIPLKCYVICGLIPANSYGSDSLDTASLLPDSCLEGRIGCRLWLS
jgi:hypothetical protein